MTNKNYKDHRDSDFKRLHRTEWFKFLWERLLARKEFSILFSDYEKNIIAKRLAAAALIRDGIGTREIGRILWLSPNTVSNLKKNLFGHQGVYRSRRQSKQSRTQRSKKTHPIINPSSLLEDLRDTDFWELIKNPPRPPGTGLKRSSM